MKSLGKVILGGVLSAAMATSSFALADQRIGIGNISISGGGLELIGTISTASLEDKHVAFTYVGWSLIVVGLLMDNNNLIIGTAPAQSFSAPQVWDAMVRQAKVISKNPSLAKDDVEIANAAKSLKLETAVLAKLVLEINAEVPAKGMIQTQALESKYFPNGFESPVQRQAFNNLVALASMK